MQIWRFPWTTWLLLVGLSLHIPSSNSDHSLQLVGGILRCFTTEHLKVHKKVTTEVDQYPSLDSGSLCNLEKYKPARLPLVKTEEGVTNFTRKIMFCIYSKRRCVNSKKTYIDQPFSSLNSSFLSQVVTNKVACD